MAQTPTSGYGAYANYGFEATYGAGAVSARTFGRDVKVTVDRKNNLERFYGIGARNASTAAALKYEGNASVEFVMANGSFFRAVMGAVADAGSGPYTHTYTETNVIPSFAIDYGIELGTDHVSELRGLKIQTCTITAAVGEPVKVRLECPYQTEVNSTASIGSQTAETEEPFTFAHGSVELPNGTVVANVQSIELTIGHDIEMLWGLGSRIATQGIEKQRSYDFKMSIAMTDTTAILDHFLGTSTIPLDPNTPAVDATIELTFSNGLATTAERSVVILLANARLDAHTLPMDSTEIIKEDVEGHALAGTSIVYTNNTAVDAGDP